MASRSVDLGDDALMEADEHLADFDAGAGGRRGSAAGFFFKFEVDKIGIFSEGCGSAI
jgi:hypothetical protein